MKYIVAPLSTTTLNEVEIEAETEDEAIAIARQLPASTWASDFEVVRTIDDHHTVRETL
jgi:hypothetical protein